MNRAVLILVAVIGMIAITGIFSFLLSGKNFEIKHSEQPRKTSEPKEITKIKFYEEYKNVTPAFSKFPSYFREAFYTSCRVLLTKSRTFESKTYAKVGCIFIIGKFLNGLAKYCNITLPKLLNEEEVKKECKKYSSDVEQAQCGLKYVKKLFKYYIEEIFENDYVMEKCTEKIPYENKTEVKKEFINYLNWVKGFVDYVINY